MTGLLSDAEMAAIRGVAESGMTATVTIKRHSTTEGDLGDVEAWTTVGTAPGWLTEITPNSSVIGEVGEVQAVAGVFRLFVPVGTDIESNDAVEVGGETFIVQHSDAGGTYLPNLTCILRRPG